MAKSQPLRTPAERKRMFEVAVIVVTTLLLIGLSRLETRLFELGDSLAQSQHSISTIIYFGLINVNVVLILVLSFLLFRNVAKLVVERRRGVLGSKLRTKLVATLVFFALAPTAVFFYISANFINESFDEWFSEKVRTTMQKAREVGAQVYKQDQRRLESLARIALQRVKFTMPEDQFMKDQALFSAEPLKGFEAEYGLDNVKVYDNAGQLIWSSRDPSEGQQPTSKDPFVTESLARFAKESALFVKSTVVGVGEQDVVKGIAPLVHPLTRDLLGAVMTETRFETQILASIQSIQRSFANLRPQAQLVKISYLILLTVMTLLILFSAVWLGFYVARGITRPIQNLAEATREVALGNYNVSLALKTDDEAGQLVRSFNLMTKDLQSHRRAADESRVALLHSNEELDSRRKYMEVVLASISAGVISVDAEGFVTSVNSAAEGLLGIKAKNVMGRTVDDGLPQDIYCTMWQPIDERLQDHDSFRAQIELTLDGKDQLLLVDASRVMDSGEGTRQDRGVVLVFDDATERVRAQRVAAWREVARRIAHEIKNPVTPIKLSAQRMLRRFHKRFEGEDRQVFETCVETILTQVDSLRDLVNEFSKFARLPEVRPRLADIFEVIADVVKFFQVSYPNVKFITGDLQGRCEFPLDPDQMNRVFVNIIGNAIQAQTNEHTSSPQVEISATVIQPMNTVRIVVADHGPGIPESIRDRVVEPYFSTKEDGTGLGLAIVNQIVSDHGGYLRIGQNEPRGAQIVIELPMGVSTAEQSGRT